ncbi:single-stranded DNA-binding protein [Candidatus Microgenomates bacterium]|nr:single-stranded DNA-binding protein [Candidatus Microgenomates bacterium]
MATRSLNKVQLIGNLTRDPELRYTPQGTAVCTFGIATNRSWTTEAGDKREEADFHRIVAWNKLAEICSQLLSKGRRVYIEGRLSTRSFTGQDGAQRQITEVVATDMIILDSKGVVSGEIEVPAEVGQEAPSDVSAKDDAASGKAATPGQDEESQTKKTKGKKQTEESVEPQKTEDEEEMPF